MNQAPNEISDLRERLDNLENAVMELARIVDHKDQQRMHGNYSQNQRLRRVERKVA